MDFLSRRRFLQTASLGTLGLKVNQVTPGIPLFAEAHERPRSHSLLIWEEEPQRRIFPQSLRLFKSQVQIHLEGCSGERLTAQLGLRSEKGIDQIKVHLNPWHSPRGTRSFEPDSVKPRLVGLIPCPELGMMTPDPLEDREAFDLEPRQTLSLWLDLAIPSHLDAGRYESMLELHSGKEMLASVPIQVDVVPAALPAPPRFDFHLSIWQDAAAVARYHRVETWSRGHWELIEAYARNLAAHGQKTITVPVVEDPWASQTAYPHPSMIVWQYPGEWDIKQSKKFRFDYTIFDRYIETFRNEGIEIINCFSPTHWGPFAYFDEKARKTRYHRYEVGDEWYAAAWNQFLPDLAEHLKRRGWLEQSYLAMDEAPASVMERVWAILRKYSSDLKIHLAGGGGQYGQEAEDLCYYYFSLFEDKPEFPKPDPEQRRQSGKRTTFYVCTGPAHPNTFLYSPAYGARQLPWLVWKLGYDGFLRWAYNSWPDRLWERPNYQWGSGDMFLVYPGKHGPLDSQRWQLLFAGIQDYQCLKILESRLAERAQEKGSLEWVRTCRSRLTEAVALATTDEDPFINSEESNIQKARRQVNRLLRELS